MHEMKKMMERLEGYAAAELGKSEDQVDTRELGMCIDMIKDCAETMYYYSIAEEMKNRKEQEKQYGNSRRGYYQDFYPPEMYYPMEFYKDRDMDRNNGRMYYGGGSGSSSGNGGGGNNSNSGGSRGYSNGYQDGYNVGRNQNKDRREGNSGSYRKTYMESKQRGEDPQKKMNQLEIYMNELSSDITEMIGDATPEERDVLKQRLIHLHQML